MPVVGKECIHTLYLGIDPGASGGIGVVGPEDAALGVPLPATLKDLWDWVSARRPRQGLVGRVFAVIEKNTGYTGGKSGRGNPGSTMFKFGVNTGAYLMALTAAGVPFEEVAPMVWQRGLGIPSRKKHENKTQWKNRLKGAAQRLFPGTTITLATADALLIAEYCRRKHEGRVNSR